MAENEGSRRSEGGDNRDSRGGGDSRRGGGGGRRYFRRKKVDYFSVHKIDDINFNKRNYNETLAYKQTKQANRMLTREWARRLDKDNILVYSMTPGFIPDTELFREQNLAGKLLLKMFALIEGRTIQEGADTIVWLASAENINGSNGGFYNQRKEEKCKFNNPVEEKKLWDKCVELLNNEKTKTKLIEKVLKLE